MKAVETALGEQENPRGETPEDLLGEDDLTGARLSDDGVQDRVGRAFGERHDPGLGEGGPLRRQREGLRPPARPTESVGDLSQHVVVGAVVVEGHRNTEIRHDTNR